MKLILSILLTFVEIFVGACAAPTTSQPPSPTISGPAQPSPSALSFGKCTDVRQPTPPPNRASLFAKVSQSDHILGASNPSVTVVIYSDFQCATCANLASLLQNLVSKYPSDLQIVFRNFPLESVHDKAALAAQAAEAANLQGNFWVMHNFLFTNQAEWTNLAPSVFQEWIIGKSGSLGLDSVRFERDMNDPQIFALIQKSWNDGQKIKIPGTPLILINGEIVKWQVNLLNQFEPLVRLTMLAKRQLGKCPSVLISPSKHYTAILKTTKGDIEIKLFADQAPNSVNNFIFLSKNGWFDQNPFIKGYQGFEVLSGDPSGTGLGNPGYFIPDEPNHLLLDRSGMVAYLNSGPGTNGSLFFITTGRVASYSSKFTIFGQVTSGQDVVAKIASQSESGTATFQRSDQINSVEIQER